MIPYNHPFITGRELDYIRDAIERRQLSGDGKFTKLCEKWLSEYLDVQRALLTHSGTAALEMTALLSGIQPGDEIIMPSYAFVTTANAFVLQGAVPVFVDIREDTLNINEDLIEKAITPKTRAILALHYAGIPCEMDKILKIAHAHGLLVIEDAAQAIGSRYKGRALGSIGQMGALSFHETKNVICGEGGAILLNDPELVARAEIIREKGTNRSLFSKGKVDKYTWIDRGSSYLPGEITAAFLWAQLEACKSIIQRRLKVWETYHLAFESLERQGLFRRPIVPVECSGNAHIYYLLTENSEVREKLLTFLLKENIRAVFHFVPLHLSDGGRKYARSASSLAVTEKAAETILRLPIGAELRAKNQERIIKTVRRFYQA